MSKRLSPADSETHRPPEVPCKVRCRRCREEYQSYDLEWDDGKSAWCCPTPGCEGMGFGADIRSIGAEDVDDEELLMREGDLENTDEESEDEPWSIDDVGEDLINNEEEDDDDEEDELEEMN